jgi:hypothetical protein
MGASCCRVADEHRIAVAPPAACTFHRTGIIPVNNADASAHDLRGGVGVDDDKTVAVFDRRPLILRLESRWIFTAQQFSQPVSRPMKSHLYHVRRYTRCDGRLACVEILDASELDYCLIICRQPTYRVTQRDDAAYAVEHIERVETSLARDIAKRFRSNLGPAPLLS